MTAHDELREAVARSIKEAMIAWHGAGPSDEEARDFADAALAVIRAVFANPSPEMIRASVQGWLDSGLMSGAIREAARVVLGDDNSAAGGV